MTDNKSAERELGWESAYPGTDDCQYWGLTKRELFAAMAMQGLAGQYASGGDFMESHVAEGAVKMADALLKELAK